LYSIADLAARLPIHIARILSPARAESSMRSRVTILVDTVEQVIKYLAIIALAEYVHGNLRDERVDNLRENLRQPVMGHWLEILRTISGATKRATRHALPVDLDVKYEHNQITGAARELAELAGQDFRSSKVKLARFLDIVIAYRNERMGHSGGWRLDEGDARALVGPLEPAVMRIVDSIETLTDKWLINLHNTNTEGGSYVLSGHMLNAGDSPDLFNHSWEGEPLPGGAYLYSKDGPSFLPLSPFIVYDHEKRILYDYNEFKDDNSIELKCCYPVPGYRSKPKQLIKVDHPWIQKIGRMQREGPPTPDGSPESDRHTHVTGRPHGAGLQDSFTWLLSGHTWHFDHDQGTRILDLFRSIELPDGEHLRIGLFACTEALARVLPARSETIASITAELFTLAMETPHLCLWEMAVRSLMAISNTYGIDSSILKTGDPNSISGPESKLRTSIIACMTRTQRLEQNIDTLLRALVESDHSLELLAPFLVDLGLGLDPPDVLSRNEFYDSREQVNPEQYHLLVFEERQRRELVMIILPKDLATVVASNGNIPYFPMSSIFEGGPAPDESKPPLHIVDPREIFGIAPEKRAELVTKSRGAAHAMLLTVIGIWDPQLETLSSLWDTAESQRSDKPGINALEGFMELLQVHMANYLLPSDQEYAWVGGLKNYALDESIPPQVRAKVILIINDYLDVANTLLDGLWEEWLDFISQTLVSSHKEILLAIMHMTCSFRGYPIEQIATKLRSLTKHPFREIRESAARTIFDIENYDGRSIPHILRMAFEGGIRPSESGELPRFLEMATVLIDKTQSTRRLERLRNLFVQIIEDALGNPGWTKNMNIRLPVDSEDPGAMQRRRDFGRWLLRKSNPVTKGIGAFMWLTGRRKSRPPKSVLSTICNEDVPTSLRRVMIDLLRRSKSYRSGAAETLLTCLSSKDQVVRAAASSALMVIAKDEADVEVSRGLTSLLDRDPDNTEALSLLSEIVTPRMKYWTSTRFVRSSQVKSGPWKSAIIRPPMFVPYMQSVGLYHRLLNYDSFHWFEAIHRHVEAEKRLEEE